MQEQKCIKGVIIEVAHDFVCKKTRAEKTLSASLEVDLIVLSRDVPKRRFGQAEDRSIFSRIFGFGKLILVTALNYCAVL